MSEEATLQVLADENLPVPANGQPQVRDMERFSGHQIRVPVLEGCFEGPLDLLLYLVRAHRYDICDIPIHDITRQFLDWLRLMADEADENVFDWDEAGDFLVTAASLMQIKSRMLLPKTQSANEDAMTPESGNDPRRELVDRLLEYQQLQGAAEELRERREERTQLFSRIVPLSQTLDSFDDAHEQARLEAVLLENVSSFDLLKALQRVLDRLNEAPVALVKREPFTIAERTRAVLGRVRQTGQLSFSQLCDDCQSRLEVVITFLSVLELIRRARVTVEQERAFETIVIRAVSGSSALREEL